MEVILFELGGDCYCFPAACVRRVVEPVPVSPIPFAPAFVDGLVNVGGRVLPQLDLERRFGRSREVGTGGEVGDAAGTAAAVVTGCLMVVETKGGEVALRIDRVLMMVSVDSDQISALLESVAAGPREDEIDGSCATVDGAEVPPHMVAGEFDWKGRMVLLLDADEIGLRLSDQRDILGSRAGSGMVGGLAEEAEAKSRRSGPKVPALLIDCGRDRFGFLLDHVREVVVRGEVAPLPNAPPEIAGLTALRGAPMLVLVFERLLGRHESAGLASVVVVESGDLLLGLLVPKVLGIRAFDAGTRHNDGQVGDYLVDERGRLIGVISVQELIDPHRREEWRRFLPRRSARADQTVRRQDDEKRRFLSFWLGGELYALELSCIQRVAEYRRHEPLPEGGSRYLNGMIELGGEVLPVADLRLCLGAKPGQSATTAYVVARRSKENWALVVDRLNRIIDIPSQAIKPLGTVRNHFVSDVGQLGGQLFSILTLDPFEASAAVAPVSGPLPGGLGGGGGGGRPRLGGPIGLAPAGP